jgi:stress-induced morphogen
MTSDLIRSLLEGAFPAGTIEIVDRTGGGDHFHVAVTSPTFDGLALVEQHRLVNRALAEPLGDGTIHELRITTKGTA